MLLFALIAGLISNTLWMQSEHEYVRLTYYNLVGTMRDGTPTHVGAAACSMWIPQGSTIQIGDDGPIVTCEDTGLGDYYWKGWIDVWTPTRAEGRSLISTYGDYTWVTILSWGWSDE